MAFISQLGTEDSNLVGSTLAAGMSSVDPFALSVSSTITFFSNLGPADPNSSSAITFVQSAVNTVVFDPFLQTTSSTLSLSGAVTTESFPILEQDVGLTGLAVYELFSPIVETLYLNQAVTVAGPVDIDLTSTLSLAQAIVTEFPVSVSVTSTLNLTQLGADVQLQELNLTQNAVAYVNASPLFEQDLGLTHVAQNTANYAIALTNANVVTQSVTIEIDDGTTCPNNEWAVYGTLGNLPFVEVSGQAKMTVAALDGSGDLVQLRNPELDDRDRLGSTRVNREGRGGELHVYRDPTWPQVNTLQGSIIGLKADEKDDWLTFIKSHLGEEIILNDWHGRYWRVVLMNPDEPVVEDTPGRWTIAFEFEGEEQPGPDVLSNVGLSAAVSVIQELTRDMTSTLTLTSTGIRDERVLHNTDTVLYKGDSVSYSG